MPYPIENSTGNVFLDLGRTPEEAALLTVKSRLLSALEEYVSGFNRQEEAAVALNVSQPRISEIIHGRLSKFSVDLLIRLCERAGIELRIETELHEGAA